MPGELLKRRGSKGEVVMLWHCAGQQTSGALKDS